MSFDIPPVTPTFPAAFLDVRTEIQLNNVWTDISGYVYDNTSTIGRGHPDESTTASASTYSATLNNSDGRFSQLYPSGPYYPYLGLNTPLRVSVPEGASYLRLENDAVSYAATPLTGSNLSAGLDIQIDVTPDNWYTPQILAAQYSSSANERSWALITNNSGGLVLIVNPVSGALNAYQLPCPVNFSADGAGGNIQVNPHQRLSVRCVYQASTGIATFYTGSYCTSWVQIGTYTNPYGAMAPYAAGAPFTVGGSPSNDLFNAGLTAVSTQQNTVSLQGKVHACILNTYSGSALANPDFTQQSAGATSFTDAASNTWSMDGTSEISTRRYRFHGYVAAWPQSWTPNGANALVNLAAGGKLRQMGQSQASVNSPMYRVYTRGSVAGSGAVAYWPFEDLANSTSIASGLGGSPIVFSGSPTLATNNSFACSSSLPAINGAIFSGSIPANAATTWSANSVRFLLQVPSGGDTNNAEVLNIATSGTVATAVVTYTTASSGTLTLTALTSGGSALSIGGTVAVTGVNGQLLAVQVDIQTSGSNVSPALATVNATTGLYTEAVGSCVGSVGAVRQVIVNERGSSGLSGSAFGHLAVFSSYNIITNLYGAISAWLGEAAGVRIQRLCSEEGIGFRGMGNLSDTVLMGTQTLETITQLMQECADADRGMWFEPRVCLGYGYRNRVSIGNQAPWVTFDYNQDHLSDTLSPTHDDQVIKNDITVDNQGDGSSAEMTLNDGSALSIGVIGRYDTSLTINLENDNQLVDEANWILHSLTVNEPRYTAINVDLANAVSSFVALYYTILDLDIGDRINVVNPPVWLPPGVIDQIMQGATEVISQKDLTESWNGVPATPFNVAYLDDVVYGRADTDGSTLAVADPTGTAVSLSIATTNSATPIWTTSSADFPFNIICGGEVMTVTNITGSSSPQTFTVTRSVNGVVKPQAAGTDVRLQIPAILSL